MEDIYPEIALKQPRADPRTVLLHKRNFLESSSDHIADFYKISDINSTTTSIENCDISNNTCKCSKGTFAKNANIHFATNRALALKTSLESVSATSTSASASALPYLLTTTSSLSSFSTSLLSSALVHFSKSCHFSTSFINSYLNQSQKTKLIFFLLFTWCAIFIQTTQAVPVRRVTTSGRKLILHTNAYREHYHQRLLEGQRQHNQQQQQRIQQRLQERQRHQHQQQLQLQQEQHHQQKFQVPPFPHPPTIHHPQQVQTNQIFAQNQLLRRHPLPLPHHRHHLHQRAAPVTQPHIYLQQYKMSSCDGNKIYQNLYQQMNASMLYIKQLCENYLRDRGNETFEEMSETWKLISLETRNPHRKNAAIENELHKKIHDFYLNLHSFDQLIDYATQDTHENKSRIEHGENISIDKIIKFLQAVKAEIKFNMQEAESLLEILEIEKPNLQDNAVAFDATIDRKIRDFLVIKNLIEEFEHVLHLVQTYCKNSNQTE